ncbi:MAG: hypothetical protein PVI13_05835 [Desulfobacterales bacterium]|jgi:hypothetical protein
MKQKYHIRKDVEGKTLRIQEFAVLTANTGKQKYPKIQDDDYSLLCEQTYGAKEVKSASSTGKDDLILLLRNQHFFPIGTYMDKIADVVMGMYAANGEQHEDLFFDDKAVLISNLEEQVALAEITDETKQNPADSIDTLIEDDSDKEKADKSKK